MKERFDHSDENSDKDSGKDGDEAWLCALVDGQLQGAALDRALDALARDPAAREAWQAYHLIGDVLRAPDLAGGTPPAAFLARLSQRLAAEPAPVVPVPGVPLAPVPAAAPVTVARARRPSANDGMFGWRRVAAAASLAVAAVGGWLAFDAWRDPSQPLLARDETGRMLRDARLDELLFAHRQFGGANGLQAPAGLLHRAAFERP